MSRFVVAIEYHDAGDSRDTLLTTQEDSEELANLFIERFKRNCPNWRTIKKTSVETEI